MTEGMLDSANGLVQLMGILLKAITDNPVLTMFFVGGLLFLGARLIRSLKRV